MNLAFTGKTVIITGGNCEMALCLAKLSIGEGLFPVLGYRSDEAKEAIESALEGHEGAYATCEIDFSREETLSNALEGLAHSPDYLVDLAHGDYETLVSSASSHTLSAYMHENIAQRALWLRTITRSMIQNKFGRLVFVSSTAAGRPNPGQGLYAASKLAAEALYKNISLELGAFGISSVSLRPGYVDSGRGKAYIAKNRKQVKQALSASQVAQTLLFLMSDAALGFNATELVMDHGLTAGKNM